MADDVKLPPGYTLDEPVKLPPGYTLDATSPATTNTLDNPKNKLQYTTPEGIPVYSAGEDEAWKQPEGSAARRGASGLWDTTIGGLLGMLKTAGQLGDLATPGAALNPNSPGYQAVMQLVQSHIDQAEKAKAALAAGRTSEAIGHTLATITPLIGPAAAHAGEQFGTDQLPQFDKYGNVVKQGQLPDIARGVGESAGLIGTASLPFAKRGYQAVDGAYQAGQSMAGLPARPLLEVPNPIPSGPIFKSTLNPIDQHAIDTMKAEGVPMTAATQTGNRYLQAAEGVTEATPLGSVRAAEFRRGTESALHRVGNRLMDEAYPQPQTPESAGQAARQGLDSRIEEFGQEADKGYEKAWQGRGKDAFTYDMPVRHEAEIGEDGKPTGEMKAVLKPVNMPVDVTDIKAMAEPIRDELQWALSRTEQSQSKAFGAIEKLLAGDDHIPAWQAERALSALKSLSRTTNKTGVRDYGQGVAAGLIPTLQEGIDAAVAATGREAVAGLQEGRAAHANMMDVVGTAEKLAAEPVQAFKQTVWAHDSGISFLRKIAFDAPDSLPKIGRAYLQDLFDRATREGGIARTKETLNRWRDLGDQTKGLLYPDANLRARLDGFFKGLDLVVNRTNTSGTEITRQATSMNPMRWLAGYVGGRVLFTERGIQLLTEGLRTPAGSAKARLIQQELKDMGGQEPPEQGPPAGGGGKPSLGSRLWEKLKDEEGSVTLTPEQRIGKDVKRRSMGDLDLRIPEDERVASLDATKTLEGKPFHELDLEKNGEGFLPLQEGGPEKANFLVNKLWQEAIQESEAGGGSTAAEAVRKTGARPPDAQFWDKSFSLPQRARYWYELSGEAFLDKHMDLPKAMQPAFIDAVAGTSGGVEPGPNLQRAIGIVAEKLQKQPVMTDLRDPASARNALNPDQQNLQSLKYGSFSGTMQYTSGLSKKAPLTTNDVQVASMFGIKGTDIGQNPVMYEVLSRFFLKLRDAQNAAQGAGAQPWETWQMQAPAWVYERIRKDPSKASEYDDYSQVFPKIVAKLQKAGVPTPGGKITMETLMDPRTPNVMSGTREHFLGSRVATLEVATSDTASGARAADLHDQLLLWDEKSNPWVRDANAQYEQIQRNTMRDLAMRRGGEGSLVSQLMSAIVGRKVDVSRLDWGGYGTFDGEVNPNLRIPLTGRQSNGAWRDLSETERRTFLSVLGETLNQKAMAASHFKAIEHSGTPDTYSVFVERYDGKVDRDAIAKFSNSIGYPVNVVEHPNGILIDVNVGGFEKAPEYQQVQDAARETFGSDPNVKEMHYIAREYASDYIEQSDYRKAIDEHRKQTGSSARGKKSQPGGSGPAGDTEREPGDLERVREAIKAAARRRNADFQKWNNATERRIEKQLTFEERKRGQ